MGKTSVSMKWIDFIGRAKLQAFMGQSLLLVSFLVWPRFSVVGQESTGRNQMLLLPPLTGDALTLTPTDMPDVTCSIVEWKNEPPKPTLAIVCPPEETFASLHLYLKLSWMKVEDVPQDVGKISAPAKTLTKIRTDKSIAWVWIGIREKPGAALRQMWVGFNAVVDVALLTLPTKR
jgi:hypothetical protein